MAEEPRPITRELPPRQQLATAAFSEVLTAFCRDAFVVLTVAVAVLEWTAYPFLPRTLGHLQYAWPEMIVAVICFVAAVRRVVSPVSVSAVTATALIFDVIQILFAFTLLYYGYGTGRNFGQVLQHFDAFYVAVGTLTTVGTGSLQPTTDLARELTTAQMAVDLVLVIFVATTAIGRFAPNDSTIIRQEASRLAVELGRMPIAGGREDWIVRQDAAERHLAELARWNSDLLRGAAAGLGAWSSSGTRELLRSTADRCDASARRAGKGT